MGIALESKTVNREKRYMGISITKNKNGTNQGSVIIATGYYETFNGTVEWVTEKEEVVTINNDQLNMLFQIKPSQLGLTAAQTNLFSMIDKTIYGVIGGQIAIHYALTVIAKNAEGQVLSDFAVTVSKPTGHVYSSYAMDTTPVVIRGDTVIAATITIQKAGYKTFTKQYEALTGPIALDAVLELDPPVQPVQPDPEPVPAPQD